MNEDYHLEQMQHKQDEINDLKETIKNMRHCENCRHGLEQNKICNKCNITLSKWEINPALIINRKTS